MENPKEITDRHMRSLHTLMKRYDHEKRKRDYIVQDIKELYDILFWNRDIIKPADTNKQDDSSSL